MMETLCKWLVAQTVGYASFVGWVSLLAHMGHEEGRKAQRPSDVGDVGH